MELTTTGALLLEVIVMTLAFGVVRVVEKLHDRKKAAKEAERTRKERATEAAQEPWDRSERPTSLSIAALQRHNARQQEQIDRMEEAQYHQLQELVAIDADVQQLVQLMGGKPQPRLRRRPPPSTGAPRPRRPLYPGDDS